LEHGYEFLRRKKGADEAMRPRFDKEEAVLVLEGLANLFLVYAKKKDRGTVRDIYLLFDNLISGRTGRRRTWYWHDDDLIPKRRHYYREMQNLISDFKKRKEEGLSREPSDY